MLQRAWLTRCLLGSGVLFAVASATSGCGAGDPAPGAAQTPGSKAPATHAPPEPNGTNVAQPVEERAVLRRRDKPDAPVPFVRSVEVYDRVYDLVVSGKESSIPKEDLDRIKWQAAGTEVKVLSRLTSEDIERTRKDARDGAAAFPENDNSARLAQADSLRPWVKVELLDAPPFRDSLGYVLPESVNPKP